VGRGIPVVYAADPDGSGHLEPLQVSVHDTHAIVSLPPLRTWQLIVVQSR
jgi:dextranase